MITYGVLPVQNPPKNPLLLVNVIVVQQGGGIYKLSVFVREDGIIKWGEAPM